MYYVLKIGQHAFVDFFDAPELAEAYVEAKKIEDNYFWESNEYYIQELDHSVINQSKRDILYDYFGDYAPDESSDEDENELYNQVKAVLNDYE